MILLIDNYDSFVYNLARYVEELGYSTQVKRNDKVSLAEIAQMNPSHILISPGPCTPNEAGISMPLIQAFSGKIPILGICLGHQAIAQVFGGAVIRASKPVHGKSSKILHEGTGLFAGIKPAFNAGRYHSLIVSQENLPKVLVVDALSPDGEIMALHHQDYAVYGLQFHPESVLTEAGYELLKNFLNISV